MLENIIMKPVACDSNQDPWAQGLEDAESMTQTPGVRQVADLFIVGTGQTFIPPPSISLVLK